MVKVRLLFSVRVLSVACFGARSQRAQLISLRSRQREEFGHVASEVFDLAKDDPDDWVRVTAQLLTALDTADSDAFLSLSQQVIRS